MGTGKARLVPFTFFVALVFSALWTIPGFAHCEQLILQNSVSTPVTHRPTNAPAVALHKAIPEYDPKTDLLIIQQVPHVSLYFGGHFYDAVYQWKFEQTAAIPTGFVFLLKVGAEKVNRLLQSAQNQVDKKILFGNCQSHALIMLHSHGIRLKAPFPVSGLTFFQRMLEQGFVDEKGQRIPQQVLALLPQEPEPVSARFQQFRSHHVRHFYDFLGWSGVSPSAFSDQLRQVTTDPELLAIPDYYAAPDKATPLTDRQKLFVLKIILQLQFVLDQHMMSAEASGLRILDRVASGQFPIANAGPLLGQALKQAVNDVARSPAYSRR